MRDAARLPRTVWLLGFTSLFMDMSSELVHSLLPLFLVAGLGASAFTVGLIDGLAEATASATRIFSGAFSDWWRHRKWLAVFGYGLSALTKPLFPLAAGAGPVLAARLLDRLGKGIRGAPRDALLADVTPAELRGAAYGLRQALDSVGALVGPLLATVLMWLLAGDIRAVLWLACVPAVLAVLVLAVGVPEPPMARDGPRRFPLRRRELQRLGGEFWLFIAAGLLLLLPRFSEAFMLLRGSDTGLAAAYVPLVLAAMSLPYALTAAPAGRLSDRLSRRRLVLAGFVVLAAAHLVFALAPSPWLVFAGAGLWGLHMGLTQGVLSALVADHAPADLRGTAFGAFHLMSGLAMLAGSVGAGWLWDLFGAAPMFAGAAGMTLLGVAAFAALPRGLK